MSEAQQAWRRLSPWAILPLWVRTARNLIREFLPVILGAGAGVALAEGLGVRELVLGLVALLLGILVHTLIWYRRFRFRIEDEGVRVRQGILQRRELRVTWDRVRNVDLRQPVYFRPLDLVGVILETPGGHGEEVSVEAIPRAQAEQIRESVGRQAPDSGVPDAQTVRAGDSEVLHQPSTRALFLHGVVSGQLWIFLAALGAIYGYLHRYITPRVQALLEEVSGDIAFEGTPASIGLIILALLAIAVFLVTLSGLIALIRYHGYVLLRDGDRFRARHGLFESRERTLRRNKLQAVTRVETASGRLLGRSYLLGHQAAAEASTEGVPELRDATVVVPGLGGEEAERLLTILEPGYGRRLSLQAIDSRFRRFWFSRLCLGLLLAAFVLVIAGAAGHPATALMMAAALVFGPPLLALVLYRRWRMWGWALDGDFLHIQSGFLGLQREIFHIGRVQQVRVHRSPYQRRAGLANLVLGLPDGARTLPFLPHETAIALGNRVLYRVETSASHAL